MSFKSKLSLSIAILVGIILILNIIVSYITTRDDLIEQAEQQMEMAALQVGSSIQASQRSREVLEHSLGQELRMAALAVKEVLDPDINNVTNEQLVEISDRIGLSGISLWQRFGDDIIVMRSSDEKELGLNSITFDYWHVAFHNLFDLQGVTVPQGQAMEHYWSGPINFATSDPRKINKWGYYYDGSTNYMINTIMATESFLTIMNDVGPDAVIEKILDVQTGILEISGVDPEFFGTTPIIKWKQGIPIYNMDVRAIVFGDYKYKDHNNDNFYIQQALQQNKMTSFSSTINGKEVIKSFIPIQAHKTYVIAVVFDSSCIQQPLYDQLRLSVIIGICLLIVTLAASYFTANFMIRSLKEIAKQVNTIASGNFDSVIPVRTKDELGMLATNVNGMASSLKIYTTKLTDYAEELRSTKEYLESFVGQTSDAIHVTDLQGRITSANRAFEVMFGWSRHEIEGRPLENLPQEFAEDYTKKINTVLDGGSVTDYELARYTKSGQLIDLSVTISPIRDAQGKVIAIASISRNITSRKNAEELIRRTEKLSVVGQLAAGVAHEVRNPLTTLRGFVQLNKRKGTISPAHLDLMLRELDHINMIVSEFLVFAKPQASRTAIVQLEDIVNETIKLLDSEAKLYGVQIELQTERDVPSIKGEPSQLKQVFVNILKNSIESMDDGGTIIIQIAPSPDNTVCIRFIDDGCGISEEDLVRLGEPFFTRKDDGHGLGVMVSQTIIANHKGTIVYRSELNKGTCVEITLPESDDTQSE